MKGVQRRNNMIPNTTAGLHRGIVIANNDPERIGRVKVFVPSVNISMFEWWFDTAEDQTIMFNGLGKNTDTFLTRNMLEKLHTFLPWAEIMHPVFGMGAGGKFSAPENMSYIESHTEKEKEDITKAKKVTPETAGNASINYIPPSTKENNIPTGTGVAFTDREYTKQSLAGGGEKNPLYNIGQSYNYDKVPEDKRTNTELSDTNPALIPPNLFSKAKGMISILTPGAHVWVMFEGGDPNYPIVVGSIYGQRDIFGIHDMQEGEG